MFRAGALMTAPDVIRDTTIDVEYVGPLARSQRMEEAVAIERLYQLAMNIAQVDPAIMDNIDHDNAIRMRAKLLGVPKTVMRGTEQVQEMRAAQAEAQQQAAMAQQAQAQAQAMNTQADATKKLADPNVQSAMSDMVDDMGMADMTG